MGFSVNNTLRLLFFTFFLNSLSLFSQEKIWKDYLYPKDFIKFHNENYTVCDRSVYIENTDLNNVQLLKNLTKVRVGLVIKNNKELNNLQGLENLKEVHSITIKENPLLIDLKGLHNIHGEIKSGIEISNNKKLEDISALSKINKCGGIYISSWSIKKISFPLITNIDGDIELRSSKLNSLSFKNLTKIENGGLTILGSKLTIINGFPKLKYIDKRLTINLNRYLKDINLNSLNKIGWLNFNLNDSIVNVSGLKKLKELTSVNIVRNESLKQFISFKPLKINNITVTGNTNLENLAFLSKNKNIILDRVEVYNNPKILDLQGFDNVERINRLVIKWNEKLKSLSNLSNLMWVGKECLIKENNALVNYDLPLIFFKNIHEVNVNVRDIEKTIFYDVDTFLLFQLSKSKLKKYQLNNLTRQDSRLIRNLIYAKENYHFDSKFLRDYFYKYFNFTNQNQIQHQKISLNDYETYNLNLIKSKEKKLTEIIKKILTDFKTKDLVEIPKDFQVFEKHIKKFIRNIEVNNLNSIPLQLYGNRLFNFDISERIETNVNEGFKEIEKESMDLEPIHDFIGITFTGLNKFHITILNNYYNEYNTLYYDEINIYYEIKDNLTKILNFEKLNGSYESD
ncbi:YARHG domain-containing protein [Aquimarina aquimarini]|uniref:YARHG domain-containing protein n=1 Tax=Aquimarina aquimarini TaxID=1191734 RepID=UPI00131F2508|nr:YARHG domain-containing protein [Aquimarina aquimarini]